MRRFAFGWLDRRLWDALRGIPLTVVQTCTVVEWLFSVLKFQGLRVVRGRLMHGRCTLACFLGLTLSLGFWMPLKSSCKPSEDLTFPRRLLWVRRSALRLPRSTCQIASVPTICLSRYDPNP